MRADRAIARVRDYQAAIRDALADARLMLRSGDPLRSKQLALARWQILRVLREYQLFNHTEIFDPIIAAGSALKRQSARTLKANCIDTATAHNNHVTRWSLEGSARNWEAYYLEATDIADLIESRLLEEIAGIEALLNGVARTRAG